MIYYKYAIFAMRYILYGTTSNYDLKLSCREIILLNYIKNCLIISEFESS